MVLYPLLPHRINNQKQPAFLPAKHSAEYLNNATANISEYTGRNNTPGSGWSFQKKKNQELEYSHRHPKSYITIKNDIPDQY